MAIEHLETAYGIRPEAKEFPMMCNLYFTYVCNSRCPNCPFTNSNIRHSYKDAPFMPADTFKIIADECGKHGAWIRISGGGEPMLHSEAVELMEYAKRAGAKIGLITNGSKFTDENLRRLLTAGVDMIEFSADAADPETYAKVRNGLHWEIVLANVKKAVRMRNALKAATKIIVSAVNQQGVDSEQIIKFWEPIVDKIQVRKYLTWGISDPTHSADDSPYLPPEKRVPCPFIFERLNIDTRGQVLVCGFDIAGKTNMGNVHQQTIKEIWHGKDFQHYRAMHLEKKGDQLELCSQCPDWKYRSWKHNYWKIVKEAEESRQRKIQQLDFQDMEGCIAETGDEK
jgi:radical SAM protein with 4Fe4S-binding SPASM domain